jgi:hypothetical protein
MSNLLIPALLIPALLVSACAGQTKPAEVNPTDMPKGPGLFSGKSGNILDAFKGSSSGDVSSRLGVNAYLWRASLETVSFMPITQADSAGGVITTDWYTNPAQKNEGMPEERVKVTVFILGKVLRADALKVTLFRQTRHNGSWIDAPADAATNRQLEDIILTKARALHVAARANQ